MRKAFFFDRDGELNKSIVRFGKPYSPNNLRELVVSDYAKEIILYLKNKNFLIIIVTNQPDFKRKKNTLENIISINNYLKNLLKIDDIFVCYDNKDFSKHRKPKNGMLLDAKKKWNIDFKKSYIVGDRDKDIQAGIRSGVKTIFIDNNYDEKKPIYSNYTIKNLKEIKRIIY